MPDNVLSTAYSTLLSTGFRQCTQGLNCTKSDPSLPSPPPAVHVHIDDNLTISLYQKSQVLWMFPDFGLEFPDPQNPNIMLASDSRLPSASLGRGQGAFPSHLHPVRIPTAPRYTEAIITLLCRDLASRHEMYWMSLLTYIIEYVDGTEAMKEEDLAVCYRSFFRALKIGDSQVFSILDGLRNDLINRKLLHAH